MCQLYRDGKRVLECLQRALRVADSCMESATSIELFVEILDRYVYYFDQRNESVSATVDSRDKTKKLTFVSRR